MRLTPCPRCDRHVRQNASACPFCDHAMPPSNGPRVKVGALLVGAAAVSTLTACPPPRPMTKYGGPPPPPVEQRDTSEAEDIDEPEVSEAPEVEAPESEAP